MNMPTGGQTARLRRAMWIGAALLALVITTIVVLLPYGLGAPETIAREYLAALLKNPPDTDRLRAAARLVESDDPELLVDGLSTRIALEFMRARGDQGARHAVELIDARASGPNGYVVILQATEKRNDGSGATRRFQMKFHKTDNDDWRIAAITVIE